MNEPFVIRPAALQDIPAITRIFHETVLTINRSDYSAEQVKVWAAAGDNREKWENRIRQQFFLLAEKKITDTFFELYGFGSLAPDGELDLLYVHKDHQQTGVASALYLALEQYAITNKMHKLFADVSITAKPFFEQKGFSLITENQKMLEGVIFVNYRMEKIL